MNRAFTRSLIAIALWASFPAEAGLDGGGDLVVSQPRTLISPAGSLGAPVAAGEAEVQVNNAVFNPGQKILLVQSQCSACGEDDGGPLTLAAAPIGRFEFARVVGTFGATVSLEAPLTQSFEAPGTQVVAVAEFESVTINLDGGLTAAPWDGAGGGILVLSVRGAFINNGVVDVSGAGFRGGGVRTLFASPDGGPCEDDAGDPWASGSGEGAQTGTLDRRSATDRWGGGGAGCLRSGGGGGSSAGAGGRGGRFNSLPAGSTGFGRGARALAMPTARLLLGGGGGGGQFAIDYGFGSARGGNGGGVLFIEAGSFGGTGRFAANGAAPGLFGGGDWGFGGGGAGGLIWLKAGGALDCGGVEARGGNGGTQSNNGAPGGGGGGGRVVLEAGAASICPAVVLGGVSGIGLGGAQEALPSSGAIAPWAGEVSATSPPRDGPQSSGGFRFSSEPNPLGYCGAPYRYGLSLVPRLEPAGPAQFSLEAASDEPLPVGLSVSGATGEIIWRPRAEHAGLRSFVLVAARGDLVARQLIEVSVECDRPQSLAVGCTCAEAGAPGLFVLGLFLVARCRGFGRSLPQQMNQRRRVKARARGDDARAHDRRRIGSPVSRREAYRDFRKGAWPDEHRRPDHKLAVLRR